MVKLEMNSDSVIIVGAGIAGLSCARRLHQAGIPFLIFEGSDRLGGRVKTDHIDGFLLDHGFQVLQGAYPEARRQLDYQALDLHSFAPGVIIRADGQFHRLADPRRMPQYLKETLRAPIGSFSDRLKLVQLSRRVSRGSLADLFRQPDMLTGDFLQSSGFSETMIERFFRPFFSGVCLDPQMRVSSNFFQFVFRMFVRGDATLPANGMAAIPRQLAAEIPAEAIHFGLRVASVAENRIRLESGEEMKARAVVVATDGPEAARLLGTGESIASRPVTCVYFGADRPPVKEPFLVLNADKSGPVHSLSIPSQVAPGYAPPGQALISVVVLGHQDVRDAAIEEQVRGQLTGWFGPVVDSWRMIKMYRIRHALSVQTLPLPDPTVPAVRIKQGIYSCGEYLSAPSTQWALFSGRQAAEALMADLKK
ncbi:MAG: NAD(P)/FAD-dependent oxidoreductase [Desulfobacterales bacterium]|jgi:phytoene dehydrogenase-like protein